MPDDLFQAELLFYRSIQSYRGYDDGCYESTGENK